jgi:hypothetical protein
MTVETSAFDTPGGPHQTHFRLQDCRYPQARKRLGVSLHTLFEQVMWERPVSRIPHNALIRQTLILLTESGNPLVLAMLPCPCAWVLPALRAGPSRGEKAMGHGEMARCGGGCWRWQRFCTSKLELELMRHGGVLGLLHTSASTV